jgi:F-type H+-transporting ATPase subunit b
MILALIFILSSDSPPWWDYPGFELWKFVNLALFVGLLVYVLKKADIRGAFRARGDSIKAELEKARTERDAALAKLKEVEERLAGMSDQISAINQRSINQRSKVEVEQERKRIAQTTQEEIAKLTAQAQREIENAAKAARVGLKNFAAEESIRMAEELIKRDLRPEDDARLMMHSVEEMGATR